MLVSLYGLGRFLLITENKVWVQEQGWPGVPGCSGLTLFGVTLR